MLAMLAARGTLATFFTLGWVAERYPAVVRRIVAGGHELASHGYGHERASDLDRAVPSRADVDARQAKLLEDIGGVPVRGYRAPSFSIGTRQPLGLRHPGRCRVPLQQQHLPDPHDHYGMPDSPRFAYRVGSGLLEIPVTTVRMGNRNLPVQRRRLLPAAALSADALDDRRVNRDDREPAIFYFHPWEIDPGQPRVPGIDAKTRFRHYVNIDRMRAQAGAPAGRLPLGAHGPRLPGSRGAASRRGLNG
jgi:polysaccharide deacetylase family protein (PEP-CTERM system associated)